MVLRTIKYNSLLIQGTKIQDYTNLKREIEIQLRLRINEADTSLLTRSQWLMNPLLFVLFCSSPFLKQPIRPVSLPIVTETIVVKLAKVPRRQQTSQPHLTFCYSLIERVASSLSISEQSIFPVGSLLFAGAPVPRLVLYPDLAGWSREIQRVYARWRIAPAVASRNFVTCESSAALLNPINAHTTLICSVKLRSRFPLSPTLPHAPPRISPGPDSHPESSSSRNSRCTR